MLFDGRSVVRMCCDCSVQQQVWKSPVRGDAVRRHDGEEVRW